MLKNRVARWNRLLAGVLVLASASGVHAAQGEEQPVVPDSKASAARLAAMQAQIEELRGNQAKLQERLAAFDARGLRGPTEVPHAPQHMVTFSAAPGRGLVLSVGDVFSLSVHPRVLIRDTVTLEEGKPTTNEINMKTMRLWMQGHVLTRDLQFGIQLAFGGKDSDPDSPSPIQDAYVDYLRLRDLNIRVGQFFVPFDRGRNTFEYALQLPDRAQVLTELGLDRDVGIAFSSTNLFGSRGVLGYQLGFFGGEGKNRFGGAAVGFLYTARLVVTPFGPFDDYLEGDVLRIRRPRLAIGVAGAYNQSTNRARSNCGTTLTLGTFDYGHAAADLVFKLAGFSLLAEVIYRQARQGSLTGTENGVAVRQWSRNAVGYVVQLGVMVHDRVELTARYDDLRAIGQTDPALILLVASTGKELNGGFNVFINGHAMKIQTDYGYQFGDSVRVGRHTIHVQLDASF